MCRRSGFSLVETLVVLAIIGVLMAIALPRYAKVMRLAKQAAADESKRQQSLVPDGFSGHIVNLGEIPDDPAGLRQAARQAYYWQVDAGKFDYSITAPLFIVRNDAEFDAYWHTLISAEESAPLTVSGGALHAENAYGEVFVLLQSSLAITPGVKPEHNHVIGWDFLSTSMAHMSIGNLGITAISRDGSREHLKYPNVFPATETVARLSQRYIDEVLPLMEP